MVRTIVMGSCVSVQGIFVKALGNGKIMVRVGSQTYTGRPVGQTAA